MNLYVATNEWLFYEFMTVQKELQLPNLLVLLDDGYNKYMENQRRVFSMLMKCSFDRFRIAFPDDVGSRNFDTIVCSSCLSDKMKNVLSDVTAHRFVLLEDGLYDYSTDVKNPEFFHDTVKYLAFPEKVIIPGADELRKFKWDDEVHYEMFHKLLRDRLVRLPEKSEVKTLVFTPPTGEGMPEADIKNLIHQKFDISHTLVCKHPRDIYDYDGLFTVEGMPGQFLNEMYPDAEHIYIYPSTVKYYESLSRMRVI